MALALDSRGPRFLPSVQFLGLLIEFRDLLECSLKAFSDSLRPRLGKGTAAQKKTTITNGSEVCGFSVSICVPPRPETLLSGCVHKSGLPNAGGS